MNQSSTIKQPWLTIVRLGWIALAGFNLLGGLLNLPNYYRQLIALDPWPNTQGWTQSTFSTAVAHARLAPQVVAWIILLPALIKILVFLSVGLVIFWRKSNEWQGLLASFVLVGICGTFTGDRFQLFTALPPVWQVAAHEAGVLIWLAFFMFLTLFPDDRFRPRWMRWVALGLTIWFVVVEAETVMLGQPTDLFVWISIVFLAFILTGKVYRYRRLSSPAERQQMRWFLFAIVVFIVFAILQLIFLRVFPLPAQPGSLELITYLVEDYLADFTIILIPVAIGIAIFRYRLWDIDLLIRRTLVYGLLSFFLSLVYFGLVTVLQALLVGLSQQQSPLTVVLSTLAIFALFAPLRRQIQAFIDRRFFRQRYNAEQVLQRFVDQARTQADLEQLSGKLVLTVKDAVEPQAISLWLAGGANSLPSLPALDKEAK